MPGRMQHGYTDWFTDANTKQAEENAACHAHTVRVDQKKTGMKELRLRYMDVQIVREDVEFHESQRVFIEAANRT